MGVPNQAEIPIRKEARRIDPRTDLAVRYVFELLPAGLSRMAIARRLGMSPGKVCRLAETLHRRYQEFDRAAGR